MIDIIFPTNNGQRYYSLHYQYLLEIFKREACNIRFENLPEIDKTTFMCKINKKEIYFDFSDDAYNPLPIGRPLFKFHYISKRHSSEMYVYPFSPISFYDWFDYSRLIFFNSYQCNTIKIMNNQRPYGNALERRTKVQDILRKVDSLDVDFKIYDQKIYWDKCLNSCMHVLVPGFSNNMIDRSHMQMMGLGVPFITPEISESLPYHFRLEPDKHYLVCSDDYSDLVDIIKTKIKDKEHLLEISHNSKKLFGATSTSNVLIDWLMVNI